MGGRGARSRLYKAGKQVLSVSKRHQMVEVLGNSGERIDLSKYPLTYTDEDLSLKGAVRIAVEAFENAHFVEYSEFSAVFDKDGKQLCQDIGGKNSVSTREDLLDAGLVYTHNHSIISEPGRLGGTFSVKDLTNWADHSCQIYMASAIEGTYSITKTDNFDADGAKEYFGRAYNASRKKYEARETKSRKALLSGKKKYKEYMSENLDAFNRHMVEFHNKLIDGAKVYGYKYALEKRR